MCLVQSNYESEIVLENVSERIFQLDVEAKSNSPKCSIASTMVWRAQAAESHATSKLSIGEIHVVLIVREAPNIDFTKIRG